MSDFLAALGLLLVIEGAVYSLFPAMVQRFGQLVQHMPQGSLRRYGLLAALLGIGIVWIVRR